ncbi:hypothetical protein K2W90_04620 [Candidatus Babeliales bacterium]|nr:hypothetical protein [Candidatus Babeliales bacterium]
MKSKTSTLLASLYTLWLITCNTCSAAANNDFEGDRSQDSFATYSDTESIDAAHAADDFLDALYNSDEIPDEIPNEEQIARPARKKENKHKQRKRSNSLRQLSLRHIFSKSFFDITMYEEVLMGKAEAETLEKKLRELSLSNPEIINDLITVCSEPLAALEHETLTTLQQLGFCTKIPGTPFSIIDPANSTFTLPGKMIMTAFAQQTYSSDGQPKITIRTLAELIEKGIAIVTKRPHSGSF